MPIHGYPPGDDLYTPDVDVTETLPDGRTIQRAVAGVPMPRREAIKAGLLPDPSAPSTGPRETKEGARRPAGKRQAAEEGGAAPPPPRPTANPPARPAVPGATPGEKTP